MEGIENDAITYDAEEAGLSPTMRSIWLVFPRRGPASPAVPGSRVAATKILTDKVETVVT